MDKESFKARLKQIMLSLLGAALQRDDVAIPDKSRRLAVVAFGDTAAEDIVGVFGFALGRFQRGKAVKAIPRQFLHLRALLFFNQIAARVVLEKRTRVFFAQVADNGRYIAVQIIAIALRGNTTTCIDDVAGRIEGESFFGMWTSCGDQAANGVVTVADCAAVSNHWSARRHFASSFFA